MKYDIPITSLSYIFDKQMIMLDIEATLGEYF